MELTHLTVPQWQKYDGLLHGFMGRRGGKSVGAMPGSIFPIASATITKSSAKTFAI